MKLFSITWVDDCDDEHCLMVAENEDKVRKRFEKEIFSQCSCPMTYFVREITKVDGFNIIVTQSN